jgi:hypothetical protein
MAASRDGAVIPCRLGEREPMKCETVRSIYKIPSRREIRVSMPRTVARSIYSYVQPAVRGPRGSRIVRFANAPRGARGALTRFLQRAPSRESAARYRADNRSIDRITDYRMMPFLDHGNCAVHLTGSALNRSSVSTTLRGL